MEVGDSDPSPIMWMARFHYGDPPDHGACVGVTMNCIDVRIISAWEGGVGAWRELTELRNLDLRQDWALEIDLDA